MLDPFFVAQVRVTSKSGTVSFFVYEYLWGVSFYSFRKPGAGKPRICQDNASEYNPYKWPKINRYLG